VKQLSHKEWCERIRAERGKSRSRYYSAICPICYVNYDVDILSSDASARELAMQKVASHLKTAHKHALTDVPT
jgi:hypothetical protein